MKKVIEELSDDIYGKEVEKTTYTENELVIHRDITEN